MNIIQASDDPHLFRPLFKDPGSWAAWRVFLRGLFGLPIQAEADRELFRSCTGREPGPAGDRIREAFVIAGRRSGKSFTSALIAAYLAVFKNWKPHLAPGERGWIFIIATDRAQAQVIKSYVSGIFHRTKPLRDQVLKDTAETLELRNGITIAVKTANFRTIRGYTILAAILEELAFYRSEESANPDKEILAAVRPALATVPDSLLLGISTPYSRSGVLWEQFRANFGKAGRPLIWKAPTRIMNPTIDQELIDRALAEDPQAARAEWMAEFREDVEAFITGELVEAVMVPGRAELPRIHGADYFAFVDPSGGRQDSFTAAIAHREESGKIILDVLREAKPPFQPKAVVQEFAAMMRAYGVGQAEADRYAGEWVVESFKDQGIEIKTAEMTASEIYLNFLPIISNRAVELLDNKRLLSQLAGLERRTRAGGKDQVSHYPGGHDDLANAAAGAAVGLSRAEEETAGGFIGQCEKDYYGYDPEGSYRSLNDWTRKK